MASGVELRLLEVGHCRHPEWVTLRGGAWSACRFPSLCVLILHPHEGPILYDTGYAERFDAATSPVPERFYRWLTPVTLPPHQHLLAQLRALGVAAADVRHVLISHLHADHVAGLRDLPRARFVALRAEIDSVRGLGRIAGLRRAFLPALLPDDFEARLDYADDRPSRPLGLGWAPFKEGFDLLGDGSLLGVPLPGHSACQLGLAVRRSDGQHCFLAADACWSARAFRERRLPSVFARPLMHDWQAYRRTLDDLGALALARPDLHIVPSHCAASIAALRDDWAAEGAESTDDKRKGSRQ
jgi:glyoxylase-like metal-dependent hydrolase (beta-lactamase superfamily II)